MVGSLLADVRYALRLLRRGPGFTLVAVASLALGIGVNTSIFSLVNALLLRPLPVARPHELVSLYTNDTEGPYSTSSYPDYADLRDHNSVFSGLAGHSLMIAAFNREGQSQLVLGEVVTGNYFDVLGVRAAIGRTFAPDEDTVEGARPVAVLGDGFWKRVFGGDPSTVGRTIQIRGLDFAVVGVAPASFSGTIPGLTPDLWIPAMMVGEVEPAGIQDVVPSPSGKTRLEQRGNRWMFLKGRLKPGVSAAEAQANVDVIMTRLQREHPQTNKDRQARVASNVRIHPQVDEDIAPGAALIMAVVGLVLLVACANVANMLLARAASRRREIGIRLAVGIARGRLIRQLLTESVLLASLGGAAGLVLAYWFNQFLLSLQPPLGILLTFDLSFDSRVLLFTLAVSIVTGLLFGLAPALQASRLDLVTILKDDASAHAGDGRRRFGFRQILVVTQVAVSMVLLVAGGLLVRSLAASHAADVGFTMDGLAVASVDLDMVRYSRERGEVFYRQLVDRLRARPEIESVALASRYPLGANFNSTQIFIEGQPNGPDDKGYSIDSNRVSSDYFRTLGVPLREGRDFMDADTEKSPLVAIVTEAFAKRFWPHERAIGKRFHTQTPNGPVAQIVGVAADYKVRTVGESPRPTIHFARSQRFSVYATVIARGRGDAASAVATLRRELLGLEPNLLLMENQTLVAALGTILFPARVGAILLGAFGLLALALAAVGLYGVIAYSVSRRTREIGVRMALGANAPRVLGLVLRQGLTLVGAGVIAGAILALLATQVLTSVLYGIAATDPLTYVLAAALLAGVALAANLVPAVRAARVDPMIALRQT